MEYLRSGGARTITRCWDRLKRVWMLGESQLTAGWHFLRTNANQSQFPLLGNIKKINCYHSLKHKCTIILFQEYPKSTLIWGIYIVSGIACKVSWLFVFGWNRAHKETPSWWWCPVWWTSPFSWQIVVVVVVSFTHFKSSWFNIDHRLTSASWFYKHFETIRNVSTWVWNISCLISFTCHNWTDLLIIN